VALPGYVERRGKAGNYGALTVDFRAGCSSCSMTNSFMTNAVLIDRAVTAQWIVGSQIYSKVN